MSLILVTDSIGPAVSLDDIRDHLRILENDRDSDLLSLMSAVERHIENYLGRTLITKTYKLNLDRFCNPIYIPRPPLVSVESVKYIDTDGTQQTLASSVYTVDAGSTPGKIHLAYNESWPDHRVINNAVEINFTAGYGSTPATVPEPIKHAIKLLVGYYNENTEQGGPINLYNLAFGVEELCAPYRLTPI